MNGKESKISRCSMGRKLRWPTYPEYNSYCFPIKCK